MPTIITRGALSAQGYGYAQAQAANYIEDVFSTYLYTGNGATQTITNGIDLSGKGGMVWLKDRSVATDHRVFDTLRYVNSTNYYTLRTNTTDAQQLAGLYPNSTGFVVDTNGPDYNTNNQSYASWTFRKQAKFFDVVTYTGTGSNTTVAHNLGSVPGCIIVKRTDTTSDWQVYHSGLTSAAYSIQLNLTSAQASATTVWNSTAPTSSVFSVGTSAAVNASGGTYVAYLFASNAGGFGAAGTDNVITCGSFTTDASSLATVNLGYEPQMVIVKGASTPSNWFMFDNMRGWSYSSARNINANTSAAETDQGANLMFPTATGFQVGGSGGTWLASSSSFIYIAIRRGPMKTPTDATKVFSPVYQTFSGTTVTDTGFVTDLGITKIGAASIGNNFALDRLRGSDNSTNQMTISTNTTGAEVASSGRVALTGTTTIQNGFLQQSTTANTIVWAFSRAPGFFDEVCYTGDNASSRTITHNLGVIPQLIIVKNRNSSNNWAVYSEYTGNANALFLNQNYSSSPVAIWGSTTPTSSVFTVSYDPSRLTNGTAYNFVAYLFATCPGVSKVGFYSGTGATQTINCGFTGGARFVLIKRTDAFTDWCVWDTARGMVAGTDPSLLLNSTAAEVNANSVYTATTGFQIVSTAAGINASGGTYIYLAIA